MFKNSYNFAKRHANKIATGVSGMALSSLASADMLTSAEAGITAAQTSGTTVGGYVVAAVAGLVVITVIIGIVKKL